MNNENLKYECLVLAKDILHTNIYSVAGVVETPLKGSDEIIAEAEKLYKFITE